MSDLNQSIITAIHSVCFHTDKASAVARRAPTLMMQYGIDTPLRAAHFIAQCAHESRGFASRVENLNYGRMGLLSTFPKYFNATTAKLYERQPERIANRVYANRMGNGNEASGDGWKYRGRGYIQVTGKANYAEFGKASGRDCINEPDYLSSDEGAIESACWYWQSRLLNRFADANDILAVTKAINGGTNGLDDRTALFNKIKRYFGV